jgi:hypothetical protein
MKKSNHNILVSAFIICNLMQVVTMPTSGKAQSLSNSPYSRYGLGDIRNTGFAYNIPMGGISSAWQNDTTAPYYINTSNPASYSSIRLTVFDFGFKNNTTKSVTTEKSFVSNKTALSYMALAFPVSKWWGACLGLQPYSNIGYKINDNKIQDKIGFINYLYEGKGGINQFYLGNGFKIRDFSVGMNISYLFGDMTYFSRATLPADSFNYNTKYSQETRVNDFYSSFGMQYHLSLVKGWSLTLGINGNLTSDINTKKSIFAANYSYFNGLEIIKDTVVNIVDTKSTVIFPANISGGAIFKKGDKWLFGFDYSIQKWSNINSFNQQVQLKDDKKIAFGSQFVPNKNAGSKEPYYKKVFYRAGFRFANTYLSINNTQLNDYAFTFGLGLPLRKIKIMGVAEGDTDQKYYQSVINLGFEIGQRGTTMNQLINEKYINVIANFTLNDKWFIKRKYD